MIFKELKEALDQYRNEISDRKKELTPNFNLLEILSPKELQLSKIIAEFLNPEGKHEQENLFLNLFIKRFLPKHKTLAKKRNVTVTTELGKNVDGQIDIVIDFNNEFGIAIENKPFAADQDEQIVRYVNYLKSSYGPENYLMIYLSAYGNMPSEKSLPAGQKQQIGNKLIIISYKDIRDWLLDCARNIEKNKSGRLKILLLEIAEYINLSFLKTNEIKNKMINKTIEKNILEAFEINKIWQDNKDELEKIWADKVKYLFNKELPKLVYKELLKRKIIDENWEFIEGNFDINKRSVSGFKIKKKSWTKFQYAILKSNVNTPKGSANIFPAIMSKENPDKIKFSNEKYLNDYALATNTDIEKELWSKPPIIWWTNFADLDFRIWDYEQWNEIKENGKTVSYLADFLEKLIIVSEKDIDKTENETK